MGTLAQYGGGVSGVRRAEARDAQRLAELSAQLGYSADAATLWQRCTALGEDEAVFVLERDGEITGWLQVGRNRAIESAPHAEIRALIVDAAHRGRGLGAHLVAAAEAWTSGQGLVSLRVRSNVVREDAHHFYRREGFLESKRQIVFRKELV